MQNHKYLLDFTSIQFDDSHTPFKQGEESVSYQKNKGSVLTIVKRTDKTKDWVIQPKHWIVERIFACLLNFRRPVINYERTEKSAISYIYLAMMCLMVKNIN